MRFEQRLSYRHPGLGDDASPDPFAGAKVAVAKWAGELLARDFPGHAWHVEVTMSGTGGLIKIRLNGIMPANRWYCVQLADTLTDPGGRRTVLKGAAELLERYRIRRGNFSLDDFRNAIAAMPLGERRTGRGHLAPLHRLTTRWKTVWPARRTTSLVMTQARRSPTRTGRGCSATR